MRLSQTILPLTLILLFAPLGTADEAAFQASGSFLTGDPLPFNGEENACETPGWNGTFGSCLTLPEGLAGHSWTLSTDSAALGPTSLMVCFIAPQHGLCVFGGDGRTLSSFGNGTVIPDWVNQVVVTSGDGLQVHWTFSVA